MKNSVFTALRVFVLSFVVLGLGYPLLITAAAQVALPGLANGSLARTTEGGVRGSYLIGQQFSRPDYFHPRPSVSDYNALSSGGSNLGPTSRDLANQINARARNYGGTSPFSADALTSSGSGLDPDISPQNARDQIERVAKNRGVSEAEVEALVDEQVVSRDLGFLGEPRVNVLKLNMALDASYPRR